jgi:hypothetical protein
MQIEDLSINIKVIEEEMELMERNKEVTVYIEGGIAFPKSAVEELIKEINKQINDKIIIVELPRNLIEYDDMIILEVENLWDKMCNYVQEKVSKWLS